MLVYGRKSGGKYGPVFCLHIKNELYKRDYTNTWFIGKAFILLLLFSRFIRVMFMASLRQLIKTFYSWRNAKIFPKKLNCLCIAI